VLETTTIRDGADDFRGALPQSHCPVRVGRAPVTVRVGVGEFLPRTWQPACARGGGQSVGRRKEGGGGNRVEQ